MDIQIRAEQAGDAGAIESVTIAAFADAPHAAHTEQYIVAALRKADALTASLAAVSDGCIVGHVAVSPVELSDGSPGWFGLGPISVLPSLQRQGIGTRLMLDVLQRLRTIGASGCVLVGDPAYYARFGFKAEPSLVHPGVPPQYCLALSLGAAVPQAEVRFHPAFSAAG